MDCDKMKAMSLCARTERESGMLKKEWCCNMSMLSVLLLLAAACGEKRQTEPAPAPAVALAAPEEKPAPKIAVEDPLHDFGKLYRGQSASHVFIARNVGTAPLVIEKVGNT